MTDVPQRIGVLLAHFNDSFQRDLWRAVRARARERNTSTVAFLGHGLNEPELRHRTSTALYHMARGPLLDGLVVFSQTVGNHSGPLGVTSLIRQLELPAVSVGYELPGIPSVRSVGTQALQEVMTHLIRVHGRSTFALITGPVNHPESRERERAVRESLVSHGKGLDPQLVFDGHFSRERAEELAPLLFARRPSIDAVVCLNDHMAAGVLDYLNHSHGPTGYDVSVVGFDDLSESQWRHPSLTTIHQPLEAMGSRAVDLLFPSPTVAQNAPSIFECAPVFRRSCGCSVVQREVAAKEVEDNLEQIDRLSRLREIGVRLQGAFDWDSLFSQWVLTLQSLGFSAGDLVLHTEAGQRRVHWTSAQGLSLQETLPQQLVLPDGHDLVPRDWIVLPLVYQDEFMGYLVLACDHDDTLVYETLRDQMSTAVKATQLMEASLNHQRDLERQVDVRTSQLRMVNRDLTEQIRQRRELEQIVQDVSNRTMQAIGQDIHDDLCQHLAGIGMLASVLEEQWDSRGADVGRSLREIRTLLNKGIDRARQYSRTLYPPGLEQHGFIAALKDLIDNFGQMAPHHQLVLQIEGSDVAAEPQVRLQLFRIAQELIGNAIKHSGSELILVRLVEDEHGWSLEVRDFGRGLSGTVTGDRMGMKILHYRADSVGATLEFVNLDPGLRATCHLSKNRGQA